MAITFLKAKVKAAPVVFGGRHHTRRVRVWSGCLKNGYY